MKRVITALFALVILSGIALIDSASLPDAHAGVLVRNQRRIRSRLNRMPRMQLSQRYLTSSQVLGRTNPKLKPKGSLDASKQIDARLDAEADYYKKYAKWREKQLKLAQRELEKHRKEQRERAMAAKKAREQQLKRSRRAQSIKDAPLNPWFGSKKAKETGVIDLSKESNQSKDPSRRVPLLKQLWRAIFG